MEKDEKILYPRGCDSAKVVVLIETQSARGSGKDGELARTVREYWTLDGCKVGEYDSVQNNTEIISSEKVFNALSKLKRQYDKDKSFKQLDDAWEELLNFCSEQKRIIRLTTLDEDILSLISQEKMHPDTKRHIFNLYTKYCNKDCKNYIATDFAQTLNEIGL